MRCDELERIIEAIADGTLTPGTDDRAHLETCARCQARLEQARAIEQLLVTREVPAPAASFAAGVMALILREQWKAERVVDLGFNMAVAAGVMVILACGLGLAWSLGFLTVTIDVGALIDAAGSEFGRRVLSMVQTIVMAAVLLTMALVLWWWAEADSSF